MSPLDDMDSAAKRIFEIQPVLVAGPGDLVVCQFFGKEIIKITIRRKGFEMEQYW